MIYGIVLLIVFQQKKVLINYSTFFVVVSGIARYFRFMLLKHSVIQSFKQSLSAHSTTNIDNLATNIGGEVGSEECSYISNIFGFARAA